MAHLLSPKRIRLLEPSHGLAAYRELIFDIKTQDSVYASTDGDPFECVYGFDCEEEGVSWEWVQEEPMEPPSDRDGLLKHLAAEFNFWPRSHDVHSQPVTYRLPDNWSWIPDPPTEDLMAFNAVTLDTITLKAWTLARKEAEDAEANQCVELDIDGYEMLRSVLDAAFDQASKGKGKDRHAQGLPFHEQRMQSISRLLQSEDGMAYQAIKKLTEGMHLRTYEARRAELLGAINYIAGILVYWEISEKGKPSNA